MKKKLLLSFPILLVSLVSCSKGEKQPKVNDTNFPNINTEHTVVTYGYYPQTRVKEQEVVNYLNTLDDSYKNEVGYYLFNNDFYYPFKARPTSAKYQFDDADYIVGGETYWFKVEPIEWNVISSKGNDYFVTTKLLLDHAIYSESDNNYKNSEQRRWMNDDFLNMAFYLGKSKIKVTEVDNSLKSTTDGFNNNTCENTKDKLFALSKEELLVTNNGFNAIDQKDSKRACKVTDFARARGAAYTAGVNTNGWYWTRSPHSFNKTSATYVSDV